MLIIEIILTVIAWQKGWRWLSLIPIGAAFCIGLLIGMSGGTINAGVVFVDVLAIIALIIMCFKKPNETSIQPPTNPPPTDTTAL
jgi:hypothetical protein